MLSSSVFRRSLPFALAMGVPAVATAQTAAPPNAAVYFINLKDGDTVTSPFQVQFGLTGMGIAPAGIDRRAGPPAPRVVPGADCTSYCCRPGQLQRAVAKKLRRPVFAGPP